MKDWAVDNITQQSITVPQWAIQSFNGFIVEQRCHTAGAHQREVNQLFSIAVKDHSSNNPNLLMNVIDFDVSLVFKYVID